MILAVSNGRTGTAMMGFGKVLTTQEIDAVVDFVRASFISGHHRNSRYHSPANGWRDFSRYAAAFPFVEGKIALDKPVAALTAGQRRGRRLYVNACITCHDRPRVTEKGPVWDAHPVSFPRGGYSHRDRDAVVDEITTATPYARHAVAPSEFPLTAEERRGETVFQKNCAFCHAADGTGRNWIGSFLQPHPRDLTDRQAMASMTRLRLRRVILEGLPGTTMSAWKQVLSATEIDAVIAYIFKVFIRDAG